VCAVRVADRELLTLASDDRTVHLWDLATGQALHLIPVHHAAYGLAWCNDDDLVVALSAGLLTVNFTACERLVSTPNGPSPSVLGSITADYRLNVVALPLSCKGRR
jgi:WD40 repeat protein